MITLLTLLTTVRGEPGAMQSVEEHAPIRERALKTLHVALNGDAIKGMHAAEVLCWNGYGQEVRPVYEQAQHADVARTRLAAWRVLAQTPGLDKKTRESYVLKMRDAALDTQGANADFTLESLAKLGYAGRDKPFVEAAKEGIPVMRILARWVLANSGKKEDEAYLAQLLDLPDERMRAVTAYALRFMKHLRAETVAHLQKRLAMEATDAPDRVFYFTALYWHGPAANRAVLKTELFKIADSGASTPESRYESLLRLGRWASDADLPRLEKYLDAEESDMRVGAANSILTILHSADRN